jgi:DNA-binding response OmpR family regulator
VEHEGQVLDRDTILDAVWGMKYGGTTRTLDQHIVKLRRKIEDDPAQPRYIVTVHTVGYRYQAAKKRQSKKSAKN